MTRFSPRDFGFGPQPECYLSLTDFDCDDCDDCDLPRVVEQGRSCIYS